MFPVQQYLHQLPHRCSWRLDVRLPRGEQNMFRGVDAFIKSSAHHSEHIFSTDTDRRQNSFSIFQTQNWSADRNIESSMFDDLFSLKWFSRVEDYRYPSILYQCFYMVIQRLKSSFFLLTSKWSRPNGASCKNIFVYLLWTSLTCFCEVSLCVPSRLHQARLFQPDECVSVRFDH